MDIGQYEKRRNELVEFIDKALALPRIPEKTAEMLGAIRKKVYENQFRIVLISGFESGKSTTFNALCDGQEVSPRGAMLRTSATVISAQNTTDDSLIGKAAVVWRSDKDLTRIFSKYLLQSLKKLAPERFESLNQGDQLVGELHYPEDLPLVKRAVWQRIRNASTDHAEISIEEDEALRMTALICEYYESPLIQQMKSMHSFSVDDIEKMVCFPQDWNTPWINKIQIPFTPEACIFLFIKEAHIYIKSENLMRTGSVLIDCPGLFASNYDTRVAFDILENADAVWYILNGIQMGQSDIDCAKRLVTAKPNKIFYTVNICNNTKTNVENSIISSYQATFGRMNVALRHEDFMIYHALLALIAIQAEKILQGKLDPHSDKAIRQLAVRFGTQYDSLEDLLETWAENALRNVYGYTRNMLKNFDLFAPDHSGIDLIYKESGLDRILRTVENAVVSQKAHSILIDNGSKKVVELLQQVEADFRVAESLASEMEEKTRTDFQDAQNKLDSFQTFCNQKLKVLQDKSIDSALASDYWQNVIVSSIDEVAHSAASKIAAENFNDVRQDMNEQIINDTFSEIVLPKATAWADNIRNGKNSIFNALIANQISHIIAETKNKWELTIKDQPILAGLPVPTPIIGTDIVASDFVDSVVAKAPGISMNVITGVATGTAIGALLGSFVFPGIGTYVGGALGALLGGMAGGDVGTQNREEVIYKALKQELSNNVVFSISGPEAEQNPVIQKQSKRIKTLRLGIIKAFEDAFEETRQAFESRQTYTSNLLGVEQQQRIKLAEEHKALRTGKIEPLRKQIQTYELEVTADINPQNGGKK